MGTRYTLVEAVGKKRKFAKKEGRSEQ